MRAQGYAAPPHRGVTLVANIANTDIMQRDL
jgi:hypothetical protein